MRSIRTLPLLVGLTALVAAAAVALACNGADTKVSGTFDASGQFVLAGAWDKDGAPISNAKGMVLQSFTTDENVVVSASNLAGKQVCLWGKLDAAKQTMHVAGFKECAAGACTDAKGASAQTASTQDRGGAGCCASKATAATAGAGASCASKATAATVGAGSSCASKATAATAGGPASCAAKTDAATAGSGCHAKDAAAKAASAGSGCTGGTDAAAAKVNKMASATPQAGAATASIVYSVSA